MVEPITIVASPTAKHQRDHAHAMQKGLARHGIRAEITHGHQRIHAGTVVCWGWRVGKVHRDSGREVCVLERGYIGNRFEWTSIGWNGLNGRATFGQWDDGGRRFNEHFAGLLRPWRNGGEYVLIVGQVPGDAALRGRDLRPWYAEMAKRAAVYGLPVRFRPHPLGSRRGGPSNIPGAETMGGDLAPALAGAAMVITHSSNTAVESLLAGVPTVAVDQGSMTWGVSLPDLPATLNVKRPSRAEWAHALAWRQFTLDEIETGKAWDIAGSVRRG